MYALARQSPLLRWRSSTCLSRSTICAFSSAADAARAASVAPAPASRAATSEVLVRVRVIVCFMVLIPSSEVLHGGHRAQARRAQRRVERGGAGDDGDEDDRLDDRPQVNG